MNSSFLARITEADCTDCPRGKYNNEEGLDGIIGGDGGPEVNCKVCGVGTYANERRRSVEAVHCKSCEAGKFQPTTNQMVESSCTSCPVGWSQVDLGGSPVAMSAPRATTKTRRARTIVGTVLRASSFLSTRAFTVKTAPQASEKTAQGSCVKTVPKESTLLLRHQTECIVCPSGTYQENLGQHWCQACGKGKYLSDNSTDAGAHDEESDCENCPIGTKILDNGGRHFEYVKVTSGKCSDVDGEHNLKSMEEGCLQ